MQSINPTAPHRVPALWKTYLAILAPMLLANILQTTSGTIDGIYLGRLIGVDAVASVSAFFPVFFLIISLIIGLSSGTAVLVGQAWGAKNHDKVQAIAGTALCLALCFSLTIGACGAYLAPELMRALGTPANILDDATTYARLILLCTPALFLFWLYGSMSRGVGDAVTPLGAQILITLFALICTPAFIRGWWGLPQLGVASAAVSTLLAFTLATIAMLTFWYYRGHPLAPHRALLRHLRLDLAITKKILQIGIPSSMSMITMATAEIVLLGLINGHGSNATAAYGAVNQVMSWMQLPAMSVGIAASILTSHAIGRGDHSRLGYITRTGIWLTLVVTGAFVIAAYASAPFVIRLFLIDEAVVALALNLLHIVAWSVLLLALANVLVGVMRASGNVLGPAALGIFSILCVELPVAHWLNFSIGLSGIWWSYVIAFFAMFTLYAAYYQLVWRPKRIARLI